MEKNQNRETLNYPLRSVFFRTSNLTLGTFLQLSGIFVLVALIIFYVLFQARNILQGPNITMTDVYTPKQHERSLTLTGTTNNIVQLTLNGKEIFTNEEGSFSHTLILEDGYTITSLRAHDRFGRKTSVIQEYVYVPLITTQMSLNEL